MSNPRFDLVDIVHTLRNRRSLILIVTIAAAVLGAVFCLVKTKKYESKTQLLVANPLYGDRNNLFRANEMRFIDYFAGEDDIDKVMVLAESEIVHSQVIERTGLAKAHDLDPNKQKDMDKAMSIFSKNFDAKRTEYINIELKYTDEDPKKAAEVVNAAADVIEINYRSYYNGIRNNIYDAVKMKLGELDSSIVVLTDSLVSLRDKYSIYDIISPARQNLIVGNINSTNGRGIEEVQNVEAVKDQLVTDRAKYTSLLNEYSTGVKLNNLRLIKVITYGSVPLSPKGPGLLITVLTCALLGFGFSAVLVLLNTYYKAIINHQR